MEDMNLDELDELEDDEEERILEQYRRQRMAQIKDLTSRSKFGDVRDISADDYVAQVRDFLYTVNLWKTNNKLQAIPFIVIPYIQYRVVL